MRAVRCHRFAALSVPKGRERPQQLKKFLPIRSVLSLDEVETPSVSKDHVLIQTHYAGTCSYIFSHFVDAVVFPCFPNIFMLDLLSTSLL